MRLKNKKWFTSLIEAGIVIAIMPILLYSIWFLATKAYKIYNDFQIKHYVLSENVKLNKALWSIRFANWIEFIDEQPLDHQNFSNIKLTLPDNKTLEFRVDNLLWETNDISYINTNWEEIYMYNKDFIDFKHFKITMLDDTINRQSLRLEIKFGIDWKNNNIAKTKFWNKEYYMDYSTTLTLRNSPVD